MADNENTILTEENESTRIINLSEASEMDAGMYFVTDSSNGTRKVPITKLIDADLEKEYAAAPAKEVGDLKEELEHITGISDDVKDALLQIASKVTYVDEHGQDYYDALEEALYPPIPATAISLSSSTLSFSTLNTTQTLTATLTPSNTTDTVTWSSSDTTIATVSSSGVVTALAYGSCTITATAGSVSATCSVTIAQATLSSISAVYTQSGTVYDTDSLDSLKTDLVVTAHWSNSTTSTVASTDYTLSGTLTAGTSTITVSYGGKTTTFAVTVTAELPTGYTKYDYIEKTNDANDNGGVIDTGIGPQYVDVGYEHELTFWFDSIRESTSKALYGIRQTTGSDPKSRAIWIKYGTSGTVAMNYAGTDTGFVFLAQEKTKYTSITRNGQWLINGTLVRDNMDTGSYTCPSTGTIRLFGISTGGNTNGGIAGKPRIYGFKITETSTGTVIADMTPCTNASDIPGFYDKVREEFYTSQDSTYLSAGNEVTS